VDLARLVRVLVLVLVFMFVLMVMVMVMVMLMLVRLLVRALAPRSWRCLVGGRGLRTAPENETSDAAGGTKRKGRETGQHGGGVPRSTAKRKRRMGIPWTS
jgi:hypothetical protein